jgi:ribulose-phosphate 3-epimerase
MSIGVLDSLRRAGPTILPSMLMCNFGNLEREVALLEEAGVHGFHLDVMDGVFVPNFTYGMTIVAAFRKLTRLPLDVHLMIQNPLKYVDDFANAGADVITFHAEAVDDPEPVIQRIHANGLPAGIAINSKTPVSRIERVLPKCQLALVMSIEAGFGGQKFEEGVLPKFTEIRQLVGDQIVLEIDGGINGATIARSVDAGAELLVVGSAIFKQDNYGRALLDLQAEIPKSKTNVS